MSTNTTLLNFSLRLHVSICVDHDQAFATNPPKQVQVSLFWRSFKYCNKIVSVIASHVTLTITVTILL
jgi:hypothetical protein